MALSKIQTGQVLQVVSVDTSSISTGLNTTSTSMADITGMTATITPTHSSSKILINYINHIYIGTAPANGWMSSKIDLYRGSTRIVTAGSYPEAHFPTDTAHRYMTVCNEFFMDSPATTNAVTYKLQGASGLSGFNVQINVTAYYNNKGGEMILMEIAQ